MTLLVLLLALILLVPKQTQAMDIVLNLDDTSHFGRSNIPLSTSLNAYFYIRCQNSTSTPRFSTGYDKNNVYIALGSGSTSSCGAGNDISISGLGIVNQTSDKLPTKPYFWKTSFILNLYLYNDAHGYTGEGYSHGLEYLEGTNWMIKNIGKPETRGYTGFTVQYGYNTIDSKITYLGQGESSMFESGSTLYQAAGSQMYLIEFYGYSYTIDSTASRNDFILGVAALDSSLPDADLITLQAPNYAFDNKPAPQMTISKPSLYFIDPDSLQNFNSDDIVAALDSLSSSQTTAQNRTTTAVNQVNTSITQLKSQEQEQHAEIMDDDTAQAESDMADFMTTFDAGEDQTLSSVITAPIRLAAALQGLNCTPLQLPLPIVNTNLVLPCPRQKLQQAFPEVILLWDGITTGLIAYGLAVHLFQIMQKAKNPDDVGKVEIFEL